MVSSSEDLIDRVLTYLADRLDREPTPMERAALAGISPDAALDVAAAVLAGQTSERPPGFTSGVVRGMVEVRRLEELWAVEQ